MLFARKITPTKNKKGLPELIQTSLIYSVALPLPYLSFNFLNLFSQEFCGVMPSV